MKSRRIIHNENGPDMIVWFKSAGKTIQGNANFVDANYDDEKEAVRNSLQQKLQVLQEEIWYDRRFGLPLAQKTRLKMLLDAKVVSIVLGTIDVQAIEEMTSKLVKHDYTCYILVNTIYGNVSVSI